MDEYLYPAYFAGLILVSALNRKFWPTCLVCAVGLVALYPNALYGGMLWLFLVPALILVSFSE